MKHLSTVIQSTRPPFLLLALVCSFLGYALASLSTNINYWHLCLAVLGAVLAHVSVNAFNEYFDYKSGLDARTHKTPFSGGSGGLVANPLALNWVLATALISLFVCVAIGVYFSITIGPTIIPIGLVGIVVIVLYTAVLNKQPWLCWLSPGIGFGTLITLGTYIVLSGQYSVFSLLVSCLPFLLSNNLLLLNQFPDIEADQSVGRKTLPIVKGTQFSLHLFCLTFAVACCLVVYLYNQFNLHIFVLAALLPLALGIFVYRKLLTMHDSRTKLIPLMGMNVAVTLISPTLFAIGVLLSSR